MADPQTVKIVVPCKNMEIVIPWKINMNVQQAMEIAYEQRAAVHVPSDFSFALQFFGDLGYLVIMIDSIFDNKDKNKFWVYYVNNNKNVQGIDYEMVNVGDVIRFEYEPYIPEEHAGTIVETKFMYHNTN